MTASTRYPSDVRERAVRTVFANIAKYDSQWAAMKATAGNFGCSVGTVRRWVRRAERDMGMTGLDQRRLKEMIRNGRGLRRTDEVLHKSSVHFVHATSPDDLD